MKNNKIITYSGTILFCGIFLGLFYSCEVQEDFKYQKSGVTGELGVTAWEFIQSSDSLQMLEEAIKQADLQESYIDTLTKAKTYIAPSNAAFSEYLETNSYASLAEVPVPILRNALKYHIVDAKVAFTDPDLIKNNDPKPYETENGQIMYLSHNSNFQGLINEGTNKQWVITTSNLEAINGVLHVVPSIVYFSAPSKDPGTPDPSIKTDTIFPVADTYVNGGSQSAINFGTDKLLKVKNLTGDGDYDRKAYLMFDLKDFKKEGVITDLTLELAVKFTAAKGVILDLYSVQDTLWEENELTFDNATLPEDNPIASLTTSKTETFDFNITDFFKGLNAKQRISFMLDGQKGTDETDEFASKENTDFAIPMLIATIGTGNNVLELASNSGFNVESGGAFPLTNEVLKVTGAAPEDVILTVEEAPQSGWLVKGATILKVGDQFTQQDVDVMNLLYINDGSGNVDQIGLSGKDRAGSELEPFNVEVTIE